MGWIMSIRGGAGLVNSHQVPGVLENGLHSAQSLQKVLLAWISSLCSSTEIANTSGNRTSSFFRISALQPLRLRSPIFSSRSLPDDILSKEPL